ncbi:MAG: hypothetical protein L6R38_007406 [Xanthoria sp. 2 TBL-2021]|nr:MAG: hypothetical protein L6R38_007406 [Xanthoria sp. 2 TBL-2021]
MAKGLRSSVKKANRSRLRSRVFGPVEEARKQRLSAKLLSKAVEPSPNAKGDTMLLDGSATLPVESNTSTTNDNSSLRAEPIDRGNEGTQSTSRGGTADQNPSMELDLPSQIRSSTEKHASRASKPRRPRRGKAQSAMIFPVSRKGKSSGVRKRRRS